MCDAYQNSIKHCFNIGAKNIEEALKTHKNKNWRNILEFYENQLKVPQVDHIPGDTLDFSQTQTEKRSEKRKLDEEKRVQAERDRVER